MYKKIRVLNEMGDNSTVKVVYPSGYSFYITQTRNELYKTR